MKNIILIIAGLMFITNTSGQVNIDKARASNLNRPSAISFYPLNLFNFLNPSFQLGYEHSLNANFKAQLSAGIILPHSVFGFIDFRLTPNSVNYKFSGIRLSGEVKYLLSESLSGKHNSYIGLESFYSNQSNNVNSEMLNSGNISYTDFFKEHKDLFGLNLKIGKQFMFRGFLLELYGGIGVAHYSVTHTGRYNPNDEFYSSFYEFLHKEGTYFRFTLPLNMKVGYKF